jgi:hypothetical protein
MASHDRRPQSKDVEAMFQNGKYRAIWQSDNWDTLKELVEKLSAKWHADEDTGATLDEFTMSALRRSGKIQGIKMLLKEIERLANESVDK